jgi:hypothetical protein
MVSGWKDNIKVDQKGTRLAKMLAGFLWLRMGSTCGLFTITEFSMKREIS